MEPVGDFFDEEFEYLKMLSNVDADFLMSHPAENLFQNFGIVPPSFFPETINSDHLMAQNFSPPSFDTFNMNSYVSQESSNNSSGSEYHRVYFPNGSSENNQDINNANSFLPLTNDNNNGYETMKSFAMANQNDYSFVPTMSHNNGNVGENNNVLSNATHLDVITMASGSLEQLKRKLSTSNQEPCNDSSSGEAPKKKPRSPRDTKKNKMNNGRQAKKNNKILEDNISNNTNEYKNESTENAEKKTESPRSYSMYGDDSDGSNVDVTTSDCNKDSSVHNKKGKTRATRGNATDPQSLYARKRRERINERLRILQTIVPNGTKVDISTMLEEAVQYVKFMQLQIQLLSSDDLWMFAPLAYNGIDVGVYRRMFPNL